MKHLIGADLTRTQRRVLQLLRTGWKIVAQDCRVTASIVPDQAHIPRVVGRPGKVRVDTLLALQRAGYLRQRRVYSPKYKVPKDVWELTAKE